MTFRRASEIKRGEGAPPTEEEFREYGAWCAKLGTGFDVVLRQAGPQLQAAAKAYPKAMKVINAAAKAEREHLENLPVVVVARMGRTSRPPRARASVVRSRTRLRARGESWDKLDRTLEMRENGRRKSPQSPQTSENGSAQAAGRGPETV